jgi:predicted aspartyl protease
MGKVIEKIKIANLLDYTKSVEVDAVIDTGATMVVLPQDIVDKLGLKKFVRQRLNTQIIEQSQNQSTA